MKKIRLKKAAGPDKIKPEFIKVFLESGELLRKLVDMMQHVLKSSNIAPGWKESNTIMIPKTRKPKANEFRPTALTNITYKLTMSVIRISIEEHIQRNCWGKDTQTGFKTEGRIENNIFYLEILYRKNIRK